MVFIESGKIVIGAEDGREVILSIRGEGEFFGEMSLIDHEPRSAHVIAMENAKLLVLRRDDFARCMREMPEIATGLLRGIRHAGARDPHPEALMIAGRAPEGLYADADFRRGVALLGQLG